VTSAGVRHRRGAAVVVLLLVAGCGGGSDKVVRPPDSQAPSATSTAATPTATSTKPAGKQIARVSPATGLVDGQTVTVTGSGFSPGRALVVVQCLNRGTATGSGDCNLSGLVSTKADAAGKVTAQLKLSKGPYGTPPLLCSAAHPCLVSITEAQLQPTEEADTPISFR
jgi:hypothetical protein